MLHTLSFISDRNTSFFLACFIFKVIHKHFYLKRVEIMAQCEEWIADIQQYSSDKRVGRTMSHHAAALKVSKLPSMSPVDGF